MCLRGRLGWLVVFSLKIIEIFDEPFRWLLVVSSLL
jgi:hypothetical protein